jgi:hypothetical protein
MPHTKGLHLWLAAWAVNILAPDGPILEQPEVAMFGFQYQGPRWQLVDAGEDRLSDTSPAFIESLNALMENTGEQVRFRAPFLEWRYTKPLIAALGREVGAPMKQTSSCVEGWMKNCGVCGQCMLRSGLKL